MTEGVDVAVVGVGTVDGSVGPAVTVVDAPVVVVVSRVPFPEDATDEAVPGAAEVVVVAASAATVVR